ncbi:hypothetical protein ACKVMT_17475 [Halobacteriales archaeon Cl-PHB]
MRLNVDPAKVLYVVGVTFGIAAVLYFARDIVFDLSITVRAMLLLLAFLVFLLGAVAAEQPVVVTGSSLLSAAAYLAFLGYTLSRFDVGADGTFLALLVSALLFIALGYAVRDRQVAPARRQVRYVIAGIVLVGVVFTGADVAASGVDYDIEIADDASVGADGEVVVGTLTIESTFVFREKLAAPRAYSCIYVPDMTDYEMRPHPVQYRVGEDRLPDTVPGTRSITASMAIRLTKQEVQNVSSRIPVERAEACPEERDEPLVVVVLGDDIPQPARRE